MRSLVNFASPLLLPLSLSLAGSACVVQQGVESTEDMANEPTPAADGVRADTLGVESTGEASEAVGCSCGCGLTHCTCGGHGGHGCPRGAHGCSARGCARR